VTFQIELRPLYQLPSAAGPGKSEEIC
jgi:hypothetical protein